MSCCDLHLTVQEEPPITLEIVEATIKPEQSKTVTPTYSEQTVLPDAGMTLGSVIVEPIPDPTERLAITENGSYDVARIGGVDVDVPQGVFPSGTLAIAENGTHNVSEYEFAAIDVPFVLQGRRIVFESIRLTITSTISSNYTNTFRTLSTRVAGALHVSSDNVYAFGATLVEGDISTVKNGIYTLVGGYTGGSWRAARLYQSDTGIEWQVTNGVFDCILPSGCVYDVVFALLDK